MEHGYFLCIKRVKLNELFCRSDGYQRINAVAPDTITSWVASAFAVSDEDGLGVALLTSQVWL